ncbi:MAG: secretin N-terminal domain-containing protein [Azonexus sp.]|nr:secretin N-terminal domain-containing protein [Azonexus sp.]
MKRILSLSLAAALLSACTMPSVRNTTATAIQGEIDALAEQVAKPAASARADAVNNALLPPIIAEMPKVTAMPAEPCFDLAVNGTPVGNVFAAIVSGTRYSIVVPPSVDGAVTLNLKNVTVFDALEAIREVYGYDYRVDGARIYVQPMTIQTRIFQVNYLIGRRQGESSTRVTSGSVADTVGSSTSGGSGTTGATNTGAGNNAGRGSTSNSSRVMTSSDNNFWDELTKALDTIVGHGPERSVIVSPISGMIVVRGMPSEIHSVEAYLRAAQISIERQVVLEAKIIEVQLNDSFQSGVNWAAFKDTRNGASVGQLAPGTSLENPATSSVMSNNMLSAIAGATIGAAATTTGSGAIAGSLFGIAFEKSNFSALISFLESQGNVYVLSSPRIATLNNQKAVLKVGSDDFYVTQVTSGTQGSANYAGTPPSVTVSPFFSGIALDVTPSIDENGDVILHVHPSVSQVTTKNLVVDLGAFDGGSSQMTLPLASSSVSETDSIVRARNGQIVAIGGLMRQATTDDRSGLPGMPKPVFGQVSKATEKRELIILLKPTVVDSGSRSWADDITRTRDRVNTLIQPAIQ